MTDQSVFQQPQAATLTHDETPEGLRLLTGDRGFFGHPRGLSTLFRSPRAALHRSADSTSAH